MSKKAKKLEVEQVQKHKVLKSYLYKGISVMVQIDFDKEKISLLENAMTPKKWVFADREIDYMSGWQNILDAMKHAIKCATSELIDEMESRELSNDLSEF